MKSVRIFDPECIVIDDFSKPDEEEEPFPELDELIDNCIRAPTNEVSIVG